MLKGQERSGNEQQEQEWKDKYNQNECWKDNKEVVTNNKNKSEKTNTTSERKKTSVEMTRKIGNEQRV